MTTAWNPLVRDGWKRLRELCGPAPTRGETYAWLHSLVEFGVYNSGKESLALDLAAHGFDPEHMARVLGELERLGDILTAGGSLVLLAALANTCAAPSSVHQIPRIKKLNEGIAARLSAPWQRAMIDVTARADAERKSRQHGVKQTLLERLKEALEVHLHAVPEPRDSSPQLELPFAAPRPEMRIVKTDELDEQALCMLALIGDQTDGFDQSSEGALRRMGVSEQGEGSRWRADAALAESGRGRAGEVVGARGEGVSGRPGCLGGLRVGGVDGASSGDRRAMAAQGKDPSAALQHDAAREARGRASGAGVSADRDRGDRGLAAGRGGQAGAAPSSAGAVSQVVRSGAAGAAESPLDRFIRHSRIDGVARILRSPVIADAEREQMLFDDAVRRTGATQAEQDEMARIAQETFPWWERGIALDTLCRPIGWSNKNDRFAELWNKARTPAMKPKGRGGLPQPSLSASDDLADLFAEPRRGTGS